MTDVSTGSYGILRATATEVSTDVVANTSDVYWEVRLVEKSTSPNLSYNLTGTGYTVTVDGSTVGSGTFDFDWRPGGQQSTLIASGTTTVTHDADGTKSVDVVGHIDSTGTSGAGGPTNVTQSITLTTLVQAPDAPTSVTATRSSDTSIALSWTRNPGTRKPYDGESVWVSIDGAADVLVANVLATATTYTYTSAANHEYVFKIKASNSAGSTASDASNTILTTPNPLASLSAAVVTSGTIRVTLPARPTPHTDAQVVITETHDGGSTWNAKTMIPMASLSASSTTTWDDTAAETGGTVQYRAVVETTAGTQGTLSSSYKTSNTLVLNTPPNAPTNLTPSGAVDASNPIHLGWTHNPSSDGATQSSRKIEYSTDGGSTTTTIVSGNTTSSTYDWTPTLGDFTAGQTITWRVATAGSQPGTYGDWSEWQTLTLYGSLAVTLLADNPPTTHAGGPIPVAWSSSPTWGTASQAQYQVTMTDTASGLTVYDSGTIASTATSTTIPASVQVNDHDYTVAVTLTDNHQIESVPATRAVTTDYLAPGALGLAWVYDDETGTLIFYPTLSEETSSPYDDTASWTLERSLDGETWVEVGSVEGEYPITDYVPRVGAASQYRTTTYTDLGIAGEPTVWNVPAEDVQSRWGWLNYGDDYQSRVRFGWSQTIDISSGRASEAYEIEGLDFPAAVFGDALTEVYAVTSKLLSGEGIPSTLATASADDMVTLSQRAATCVARDAHGRWFLARVKDVKPSPQPKKSGPDEALVSFTMERVTA